MCIVIDSTDMKNELYKTVYTGGVSTDVMRYDENGDPVGANYSIMIVKNGKAEPVK